MVTTQEHIPEIKWKSEDFFNIADGHLVVMYAISVFRWNTSLRMDLLSKRCVYYFSWVGSSVLHEITPFFDPFRFDQKVGETSLNNTNLLITFQGPVKAYFFLYASLRIIICKLRPLPFLFRWQKEVFLESCIFISVKELFVRTFFLSRLYYTSGERSMAFLKIWLTIFGGSYAWIRFLSLPSIVVIVMFI